MNFLKNVFKKDGDNAKPDNTKLLMLINNWVEDSSYGNYKFVVEELLNDNSFLMLPTEDTGSSNGEWVVTKEDKKIILRHFDLDGLKVLAAFTDEQALSLCRWGNEIKELTSLKSKFVISICEQYNIKRIVINNDAPNMFVLENQSE